MASRRRLVRSSRTTTHTLPIGEGLAQVLRIDPTDGSPQAMVSLSGDAGYLAVGPDAIWVAEPHQWLLARIDPVADRVDAEWPIAPGANQIVLEDPGRVWVLADLEAVAIDIASGREVERFRVPNHAHPLGVSSYPLAAGFDSLWWADRQDLYRLAPIVE